MLENTGQPIICDFLTVSQKSSTRHNDGAAKVKVGIYQGQ
jgi:hypothetical protein